MGSFDEAGTDFNDASMGFDSAVASGQFNVDDLYVQLWLKDPPQWTKVTSSVRTEDGIRITRGRQSEDGESSPSTCSLTLDNTLERYSPRNTSGSLYGRIGRNTGLRVGFGNPGLGRTDTGSGATLDFEQVAEANGYGTTRGLAVGVCVPADTLSTPAGYSGAASNSGAAFTVRRARITDADVLPATTMTASGTPTGWATVHIALPSEAFVQVAVATADAGLSTDAIAIDTFTPGNIAVAVVTWSQDSLGRMGPPWLSSTTVPPNAGYSPVEMYLIADSGPSTGPRIAAYAWEVRDGADGVAAFGADDGATGVSLSLFEYTVRDRYSPRFSGEIADWPVTWDASEADKAVSIEAGGVTRRLAQATDAPSMLRAALGNSRDLTHYWPMEDPAGAPDWAPAVGPTRMTPINGIDAGAVDAIRGSYSTPSFTGRGAQAIVDPPNPSSWGFGGVAGIPEAGTLAGTNLLFGRCPFDGDIATFGVEYTSDTQLTIKVMYTSGTIASAAVTIGAFPDGINGGQVFLYVAMAQSGADVSYSVSFVNVTPGQWFSTTTSTGTLVAHTLGALGSVTVCTESVVDPLTGVSTKGTNDVTVGHVFVTSGGTLFGANYRLYAARAYDTAILTPVMWVTSTEAQVPFTFCYPSTDRNTLGPMAHDTPLGRMRTLAVTGQGLLQDAAGFVGLEWRPLHAVNSRPPVYTFDYDNDTFANLAPVDDDAVTLNDVTVTAPSGLQARVQVSTGALGNGTTGIGRYSASVDAPVPSTDAARDLAGWLTSQGTVDLARWPLVSLRMSGTGLEDIDMPQFSIGDTVMLDNLPAFTGPTTLGLVVVGLQEDITDALWTVTLVTRPAELYHVLIWDDTTFGIWADDAAPTTDDAKWGL